MVWGLHACLPSRLFAIVIRKHADDLDDGESLAMGFAVGLPGVMRRSLPKYAVKVKKKCSESIA